MKCLVHIDRIFYFYIWAYHCKIHESIIEFVQSLSKMSFYPLMSHRSKVPGFLFGSLWTSCYLQQIELKAKDLLGTRLLFFNIIVTADNFVKCSYMHLRQAREREAAHARLSQHRCTQTNASGYRQITAGHSVWSTGLTTKDFSANP